MYNESNQQKWIDYNSEIRMMQKDLFNIGLGGGGDIKVWLIFIG